MGTDLQTPAVPGVVRWGQWLIRISLLCLTAGSVSVKLFFPQLPGRGLDVVALAILVPIWAIGLVGILLLLVGWMCYPLLDADLDVMESMWTRSQKPLFGWLTKSLALLAAGLVWLSSLLSLVSPEDPDPLWGRVVANYCITSYCGFILYLVAVYSRARHLATNTYLNRFTPLPAFILVPVTWPLLILLNWVLRKRSRPGIGDTASDKQSDD